MEDQLEHGYTYKNNNTADTIIKVVGVGGGGGNAINHMIRAKLVGADLIAMNTDSQALNDNLAPSKLQLGVKLTKGLGAGTKPESGMQAANENLEDIKMLLGGATEMVFVTAGMGGGTGTGAAPVVAKIARDMDKLTIAVVTSPYHREGTEKIASAMEGINQLKQYCDTVLVVDNNQLSKLYPKLALSKAHAVADDVLATAVKTIVEIITKPGIINIDFNDVKTVLTKAGKALIGSAEADGDERADDAVKLALESPLLKDCDITGAKRILLNLTSSEEHETTQEEYDKITEHVVRAIGCDPSSLKTGTVIDESMGTKMRVTIIVAGFDLAGDADNTKKSTNIMAPKVSSPHNNTIRKISIDEEQKHGLEDFFTATVQEAAATLTSPVVSVPLRSTQPPTSVFQHATPKPLRQKPAVPKASYSQHPPDDSALIEELTLSIKQKRYTEFELDTKPAYQRQNLKIFAKSTDPNAQIIMIELDGD